MRSSISSSQPQTKIILFQCSSSTPSLFNDQVNVNARDQVDEGSSSAPGVESALLESSAQLLYNKVIFAIAFGHFHLPYLIKPAAGTIRVQIRMKGHNSTSRFPSLEIFQLKFVNE